MDSTAGVTETLLWGHKILVVLLLGLTIPIALTWSWRLVGSLKGEPPLVPYWIPWLGHGLWVVKDINEFVAWAR